MANQAKIQGESFQYRSQGLDIADNLEEVADEEATMDRVDSDLDLLNTTECIIRHLDA